MEDERGRVRGKRRVGLKGVEAISVEGVEMLVHRRIVHGEVLEEGLLLVG